VKLIVGLGNPGREYHLTPHNLGFMGVERLAGTCGVEFSRRQARARVAYAEIEGEAAILAKPQTFMNLSGLAVRGLLQKRNAAAEDLVILVDDVDLPLGALRIRLRGSAGGHNGLKSIIETLGTDQFVRVRMGAGPDRAIEDLVSYVLTPFRRSDLKVVADMVDRSAEAARIILKEGPEKAMNLFNRKGSSQES
jgi:peptidyl-tRNA hydrolase, PTH1 family